MKMYQEKKVVIISVIVLLVALWLVYALFFGTKWKDLFDKKDATKVAQVDTDNQEKEIVNEKVLSQSWVWLIDDILENTWEKQNLSDENILTGDVQSSTWNKDLEIKNNTGSNTHPKETPAKKEETTSTPQNDEVWALLAETEKKAEQVQKQPQPTWTQTDIKILHLTELYSWRLDIINELWLNYKYILKDANNVYFIYLGNAVNDMRSKASKIGWNTVEITDKKVIMENSLFWEKVIFVNIPKYQRQYVFVVVKPSIANEYWLMQINFKDYYMLKKYLQTLFTI